MFVGVDAKRWPDHEDGGGCVYENMIVTMDMLRGGSEEEGVRATATERQQTGKRKTNAIVVMRLRVSAAPLFARAIEMIESVMARKQKMRCCLQRGRGRHQVSGLALHTSQKKGEQRRGKRP